MDRHLLRFAYHSARTNSVQLRNVGIGCFFLPVRRVWIGVWARGSFDFLRYVVTLDAVPRPTITVVPFAIYFLDKHLVTCVGSYDLR